MTRGKNIDQETCEKLFNCSGTVSEQQMAINEQAAKRLEADSQRHAQATIARNLEENNQHFSEARDQLDKWAEDMEMAAQKELDDTKRHIRDLQRRSRQAPSMDEQLGFQEDIAKLERKKRKLREKIFDIEDEIVDKRDPPRRSAGKTYATKNNIHAALHDSVESDLILKEISMPSAEQLRSRLLKKLSELFQLDQPDLDFGFYRIMHAKAQEVQDFIGTDLLKIVADAFGDVDKARKAELQAAYEKAIQTAKDFGAPSPEETEPVKKAKAALDAVKDTASAEADVYDHLYRFFERYYDDGDFISRRYYTRETSGKAAPFAVPYNGEDVKLHWANADQYYIKSAEYFSNFTFDLRQAQEIRAPAAAESDRYPARSRGRFPAQSPLSRR